jgi:hypothetical protein
MHRAKQGLSIYEFNLSKLLYTTKIKERAMERCKLRIPNLLFVLTVFELILSLFVAPVVARYSDPEPRTNLSPDFMETFDDPTAPGWNLSSGATIANGILNLEQEGAQASYDSDWYNYTTLVRMRCTSPGIIGVNLTTDSGDIVRLVLGGGSIKAQRVLPGLAFDMIVERHIQTPPELPVGEWFRLELTQLGGLIVVGVDGMRLCDLYDPSPEPIPPSGLTLAAMGDTSIEVETVAVVPWVVETFSGPLSSAWNVSSVETKPFIEEGKLIVPSGEFAVRTGHWEEMTFHARVRRDRLVNAALTYGGHVLTIYENYISLSSQVGGQLSELAGVPLPEFPAEPETAAWMDVTIVVRDGEHHVFAYGVELFSVSGEAVAGAVSAEAFEGRLELERLMLGWPLPLWPAAESPGEPGGEEPGTGLENTPSADLAVTDLYPDQMPSGRLYFRITNNGPDTLDGAPVIVMCGGTKKNVTTGVETTIPDKLQGTFNIFLAHEQTQKFPTQINLDLSNYSYDLKCTVYTPLGSGAFIDPKSSNNTYKEKINAIALDAPSADLIMTDLFVQGIDKIFCRITNNGPDALLNAAIEIDTNVYREPLGIIASVGMKYGDITLQVGGIGVFDTGNIVHDDWCDVTSEVTSSLLDPEPGNNSFSKQFGLHLIQTDLAVTDIFPDKIPQGDVYCRITNRGPDDLKDATFSLLTVVTSHYILSDFIDGCVTSEKITTSLDARETKEFLIFSGIDTNQFWYGVNCSIDLPLYDPKTSNNSYSETIPPQP